MFFYSDVYFTMYEVIRLSGCLALGIVLKIISGLACVFYNGRLFGGVPENGNSNCNSNSSAVLPPPWCASLFLVPRHHHRCAFTMLRHRFQPYSLDLAFVFSQFSLI